MHMYIRNKFRRLKLIATSPVSPTVANFVLDEDSGTSRESHSTPALGNNLGAPGWPHLRLLYQKLQTLDNDSSQSFRHVFHELLTFINTYQGYSPKNQLYEALRGELEKSFEEIYRLCSQDKSTVLAMIRAVRGLCMSMEHDLGYLRIPEQERIGLRSYYQRMAEEDNSLTCYHLIRNHLRRIILNMSMWRIVETISIHMDYQGFSLSQSLPAGYDSHIKAERSSCTHNTRVNVLSQIHHWLNSSTSSSVYWINGMAGTGKTTIAYSLCKELDASHKLAASFFCSRLQPECRASQWIIPLIAYQLAEFSDDFRNALCNLLGDPDLRLNNPSPRVQLDSLIYRPLLHIKHALPGRFAIVLDALDECEDKEATRQLLEALIETALDLPVRFIVSSRPEPEIREPMRKQQNPESSRVLLHEIDEQIVQNDIKTYLQDSLLSSTGQGSLRTVWKPTADQLEELAERAGVLFICAAAAVQYINYGGHTRTTQARRLANILELSIPPEDRYYTKIDTLYTLILQAALENSNLNEEDMDDILRVLHLITSMPERLAISTISRLLKMSTNRVWAALRPLWSVLHISDFESVTTLHPSFVEYINDPLRSNKYCRDLKVYSQTMAQRCLIIMQNVQPQFNICGLESSYIPDSMVPRLKERVCSAISKNLFYASQNWAVHLKNAPRSAKLLVEVEEFLSIRLLLWMEVMNLKGCASKMPEAIRLVMDWVGSEAECSADLRELIHDAWRFTAAFAYGEISNSTPHIYISMLRFWPDSSMIAQRYAKRMQHDWLIKVEGTAVRQREYALLSTWHFNHATQSAVFSPDGTQIAVGVGSEVELISALTGKRLSSPLKGHTNTVLSVQFSPNGTLVASCSLDKTVCLWSIKGETSPGLLLAPRHATQANCIKFSPDGAFIASGANDGTIRIWRSGSDVCISTFIGNHGSIAAICFAPTGRWIVTGGWNNVIVWNSENGQVLMTFFSNNINEIFTSVDISSDGMHIVACSNANGLYVWNTETGELGFSPLKSMSRDSSFTSVSFTPDGSWLVSGSRDGNIHIWDAQSGNLVRAPLEGHTDSITTARSSLDGALIMSGSYDKTIRFWDARIPEVTPDPLSGHFLSVTSVGFSPNGTRIISGSADGAVCIWDSENGEMVLGPLKKDHGNKMLITYSPCGTYFLHNWQDGVVIRNAQTGDISMALEQFPGSVHSAVFSADGNRCMVGTGNIIQILAVNTGQALMNICPPLTNQSNWVHPTSAVFSPDGDLIAVGSAHSSLYMYNAHSGELLYGPLEGHNNSSRSLIFSPDSRHVASGEFSTIFVRDAQSGEKILGPLDGHTSWVSSVEYSPQGDLIVSGGRDGVICVWDAQTGRPTISPVKWHAAPVRSVRFSPDGTRVVSGSDDKTIRVTDIKKDLQFVGPPHIYQLLYYAMY
ncbi:unnamed protein product [Rhizoctonia solani]|uniref:NACHT domain-containing protein n=1 Tax=Rhizoctonia solani TaxID=456999 RepID=A0A8H2XKN0_9AGAM|nr:unnamed protein product [Rhizoctonia solani]